MRRDGRVGLRHSPAKRVRDQNPSVGSNPTLSARTPSKTSQRVSTEELPPAPLLYQNSHLLGGQEVPSPGLHSFFYKDTHQTINIMQSFSGNLIASTNHCALFSLLKASANRVSVAISDNAVILNIPKECVRISSF